MKIKNYFLFIIFIILLVSLIFISNWDSYPKNPNKLFEIRYFLVGNSECLVSNSGSAVDIRLTRNEIYIRDIRIAKLCDFEEGYIDFYIDELNGEPFIEGLDKNIYFLNKTGINSFRVYLNSDMMNEFYINGSYTFSVKTEISDKFYTIYEIFSNTKPWMIFFDYPTHFFNFFSLSSGYSCNECFSLLEGNLRVHPDEKIYETKNIGERRFFFEDEERVVIRFNPQSKFKETFKGFFLGLIISILAGIITFFLLNVRRKEEGKEEIRKKYL